MVDPMSNFPEHPMSMAMAIAYHPTLKQELAMGGAAVVMLIGAWLCWGAPRYRMMIEERVKDGKLADDLARRRILQSQWFGPVVTSVGVALLAYVILR